MRYAINENGCVVFKTGETPFPAGSAWPIPSEFENIELSWLRISGGQLVQKTADEVRIMNLPAKYKLDGGLDAEGNQLWFEKSQADKDAADAAEVAAQAAAEQARQDAKSPALKKAENDFMSICGQITDSPSPIKLGFGELEAAMMYLKAANIQAYNDARDALEFSKEVCVRENGLKWWDDCIWHTIL